MNYYLIRSQINIQHVKLCFVLCSCDICFRVYCTVLIVNYPSHSLIAGKHGYKLRQYGKRRLFYIRYNLICCCVTLHTTLFIYCMSLSLSISVSLFSLECFAFFNPSVSPYPTTNPNLKFTWTHHSNQTSYYPSVCILLALFNWNLNVSL